MDVHIGAEDLRILSANLCHIRVDFHDGPKILDGEISWEGTLGNPQKEKVGQHHKENESKIHEEARYQVCPKGAFGNMVNFIVMWVQKSKPPRIFKKYMYHIESTNHFHEFN